MAAVIQRPLRGSRISTFYPVKNLPSLSSLDSAFQLQEYISLLIRLDVHDVDSIVSLPGTSKKDAADGDAEKSVDEACWIYEQLRRLAQDLSHPLITTLQQECNRASCPEMKAGEWLYLCVAHGNDGAMEQCCAIDYILHTVDSATALLNSPRTFPSRLQIPQTSHRHFSSLARRLGRIFAHAYFHHREAFEQAEAESSLYARFLALTSKFDLVPPEFLVIPPAQFTGGGDEAGGGGHQTHERDLLRGFPDRAQHPLHHDNNAPQQLREEEEEHNSLLAPPPSAASSSSISASIKHLAQQQLGVGRRSPPAAAPAPQSTSTGALGTSGSPNGGIGETPSPASSASKSRFGRSRTDTMIFSEPEASAFADELAARSARAASAEEQEGEEGQLLHHREEPKGVAADEADIEPVDESEVVPFEISLEEEARVLEDLTGPVDVSREEEVGPAVDQHHIVEGIGSVLDAEKPSEASSETDSGAAPAYHEAGPEPREHPAADAETQPVEGSGSPNASDPEAAVIGEVSLPAEEPTEEDVTDASQQDVDAPPSAVVGSAPATTATESEHASEQAQEPQGAVPPVEKEEEAAATAPLPVLPSEFAAGTAATTTVAAETQDAEDDEPTAAAADTSILEESEVAALVEADAAAAVEDALESDSESQEPSTEAVAAAAPAHPAEHGHEAEEKSDIAAVAQDGVTDAAA